MDRRDELKSIIYSAREELSALERSERAESNARYVGRCFKFRNSYGDSDDSARWWLYRRIVSADGDGAIAFQFQTDRDGKIEVELAERIFIDIRVDAWTEITLSEFGQEWNKVATRIGNLHPNKAR